MILSRELEKDSLIYRVFFECPFTGARSPEFRAIHSGQPEKCPPPLFPVFADFPSFYVVINQILPCFLSLKISRIYTHA